jgi:hypothetical protein
MEWEHQCSLQHYSQLLKAGHAPRVHQNKKGCLIEGANMIKVYYMHV